MSTVATASGILDRGGTILAASHRLARHLRLRHDETRARAGDRAWPTADVLALDAWLRRAWEALALANAPEGQHRLLTEDECRLVWHRVIADSDPGRMDVAASVPLVASGWRLCQAWGISPGELAAAADTDDARLFAGWVRAYGATLARQGWQDSSGLLDSLGRPGATTGLLAPAAGRILGFAGFDPWTPAQRRLAECLAAAGVPVATVEAPRREPVVRELQAPDPDRELAAAFTWAAALVRAGAEPPAIVLPDLPREAARARRIGLDILAPGWRLREPPVAPLAVAPGRQLADYPVVAIALDLLAFLAGGVDFEPASRLLRSRYLAGFGAEEAGRARAELDLRRLPLDRISPEDVLPLLGRHAPATAARWERCATRAAAERGGRETPAGWARVFAGWLAAAGWPGERAPGSEEFQVLEAWQGLLEAFAGTAEVAGRVPAALALAYLRQLARDRPFEPESPTGAIAVLSLREAEGQDFPALWVCGLTADQWPPAARPHALVPLALQQAAGIPEAALDTHLAATERRFDALLASAPEVVLSWPAERDEAAALPSPRLLALAPPALEPGPLARQPDRERVAASGSPEVAAADAPPAVATDETVKGGVRLLDAQSACPARAFVEFRLGGVPLEPPARPLDARSRGVAVHAILEALYRAPAAVQGLHRVAPDELRALFDPIARRALEAACPRPDAFVRSLCQLEQERLWALVLSLRDLDDGREPFAVRSEVKKDTLVGALPLHVRFDRIDDLAAGGSVVIDYKTGASKTRYGKPRPPACQLLLYAVAGEADGVAVIELRAPRATLAGIGAPAALLPGMKPAEKSTLHLGWPETLRHWQGILEGLATEFLAGDFRVDPRDREWGTGQYAAITRLHEAPVAAEDEPGDGGE